MISNFSFILFFLKLRIVENEYLETKSKIYYGASDESQYSKKHANENEKENSLLKSKIMDLEFMLEEKVVFIQFEP